MDGMKNDIEKVGDYMLSVVQGALKAKNNGLEKEGKGGGRGGGGLLLEFIEMYVGAHLCPNFEVECAKVWFYLEHAFHSPS
jgi:hypothetical protein